MRNFLIGFVFGIVVATVGFSGIAQLLDTGVEKVKQVTRDQVQQ